MKLKAITKEQHNEAVESLPVYEIVREWLETQKEENVMGCVPVAILKEIIEIAAFSAVGNYENVMEVESDF